MARRVIVVRGGLPAPLRTFLKLMFLGVAIESVIHSCAMFHSIQARRPDVHTNSSSH